MNINKIQIIGNITKQPEILATKTGTKIVSLNVATNRYWETEGGEKKEEVTYHTVKAFGKQAETIAQYCNKGDQIYYEARMVNNNYEKDGKTVYQNDFIMENFQFGKKAEKKEEQFDKNEKTNDGYNAFDTMKIDDIPDFSEIPF